MPELEVPTTLPVRSLSHSSVSTFRSCPEKWRRKYIDKEYDPPGGPAVQGSAVHAAEADASLAMIEGGDRPPVEDVIDRFVDEFDERAQADDVIWGEKTPGVLKDQGVEVVRAFERDIAPSIVTPITAEKKVEVVLPHVEWGFVGFIDLEEADGRLRDTKVSARKSTPAAAHSSEQATGYMMAQRALGEPWGTFSFDFVVKTKEPYGETITTHRGDAALDRYIDGLYRVATEIAWRMETGVWSGAVPGDWLCSQRFCPFWTSCTVRP